MKIAITGHTAGIGAAFCRYLSLRKHEIVGISRREGNNIRNIPKTIEQISSCDMWINNAQAGYAQTELLYKIWQSWAGNNQKMIWLISTMMTTDTNLPNIPGYDQISMSEYKNQKKALEDAFYTLRSRDNQPRMILIRPGKIDTQGLGGANVDAWVRTICEFYMVALDRELWIDEISLGSHLASPIL